MRKQSTPFRNPPPPAQLHWLWQHSVRHTPHQSCAAIWKQRREQLRAEAH